MGGGEGEAGWGLPLPGGPPSRTGLFNLDARCTTVAVTSSVRYPTAARASCVCWGEANNSVLLPFRHRQGLPTRRSYVHLKFRSNFLFSQEFDRNSEGSYKDSIGSLL